MIVNHEYRYIFLKTRKTAGSSVELALSAFCGPDDLITPMRSEGRSGQNFSVPFLHRSAREHIKAFLSMPPTFQEHTSAVDAKRWLGSEIWGNYFKFTIERNPWARYVSQYFWNTRPGGTLEGKDLQSHFKWAETWRKSNWDIYAIDDQVVVDKIMRYENLENDLADVTSQLGMPDLNLPRAKSKHRRSNQHYSEVLPDDLVKKIQAHCAREIKLLGYEFEGLK